MEKITFFFITVNLLKTDFHVTPRHVKNLKLISVAEFQYKLCKFYEWKI